MASSAAYAYKPHVRQEGFHLPSPPHSTDTPPPHAHAHDGIFAMGHGFHAGDFNDELAGLINPQSNERSTQSPTGYEGSANGNNNNGNGSGGGGSDGGYRPPPHTHNIFDISAPSQHHANAHHHGSASSTSSSFPAHFSLPSAGGDGRGSPGGDAPQPAPQYHFNSTLPALNSSMRYDPHPPPGYMPSPSSFRSPSPHHTSRSRSRSRPPSSHLASNPTSGPGPTRTTRTRRNGSLSSTSPPPRPVPQAIVIPGSHGANNGARGSPYGAGWFGVNGDYPHATPDSLPSLTSLPSLNSLGSYSSHHLGSPHLNPHSPHLNSPHHGLGSGSPHPFAINGGGMYANNTGSYGSPVEAKFGGMGLHGGHHGGYGGMGSLGPANIGLPSSLGTNGLHGSGNGNGNGMSGSLTSSVGGTASLVEGNGNGNGNGNGKESKAESKATLLAHEKRRRRRESHNAVERRRRDNINEKISELATLIPECLLDGGGQGGQGQSPSSPDDALLSPTGPGAGAGDWPLVLPGAKKEMMDDDGKDGKEGAVVKANKGMILRKSVEYIRYLQQLVASLSTSLRLPRPPHDAAMIACILTQRALIRLCLRHPISPAPHLVYPYPPCFLLPPSEPTRNEMYMPPSSLPAVSIALSICPISVVRALTTLTHFSSGPRSSHLIHGHGYCVLLSSSSKS
ncbi:helix-loop-helix DNA-binding domain-containing protein [Mycena polygramma]|nr:helix-loop-helix DNA-binding domain-containing protein [Mycena polygramma]